MNYKYLYLSVAMVSLPLQAQTLPQDTAINRVVVVEQQYNPEIQDAQKINVLPQVQEPTVAHNTVEYDTSVSPSNSIPTDIIPVFTGTEEEREKAKRGYIRAGYGNYGNLDVKGNYLFLSEKDKVNLSLSADGTNGKLTLPVDYGNGYEWKSRYYQTRAGLDYEHRFKQTVLELGGHGQVSDFNLLPTPVDWKQQFVLGDAHVGLRSFGETLPLRFQLETNLLYYSRKNDRLRLNGSTINNKETIGHTKANIAAGISDTQFVGIAFKMNNVFYDNPGFSNYTTLDMNPYYELNDEGWKLHAGINVDVSLGYGKELQLSPDVLLQRTFSDSYVLYAKASGGRQINDFRQLEVTSPYAELTSQEPIANTYEQINATLGFKASPVSGFWFNVYGGYQSLKDDLYQWGSLILHDADDSFSLQTVSFKQAETFNLYAGIRLAYAYKDRFNLSANGNSYAWGTTDSDWVGTNYEPALYFKPAYSIDLSADIQPYRGLTFRLGYEYIARKKMGNENIAAINDLNFGATYRLYKGLSVYVRGGNLLNREYQYYYMYPTEGIHVLGGVSVRF
ncbi:hypothetical protein EZS27_016864 [termite gut metagenome]|uniref:TonB-dependent receptor n=1 Tax=termite gut metagenome TaxID=433724 RepID=A0A5J4RPN9_9ZZZZ